MKRNEPCFCGSGKKLKRCHPDIRPDSRAAKLLNITGRLEERVQQYQEESGNRPPCWCYMAIHSLLNLSSSLYDKKYPHKLLPN